MGFNSGFKGLSYCTRINLSQFCTDPSFYNHPTLNIYPNNFPNSSYQATQTCGISTPDGPSGWLAGSGLDRLLVCVA